MKATSRPLCIKRPFQTAIGKRSRDYFQDISTTLDPRKLTSYVWFVISTHFCLRGGEIQCKLKKQDLIFQDDRISLATDFMTKNHRGGLKGTASTTAGCIKDPVQVAAIRRFMTKLNPDIDRLFQRARAPAGMLVCEADECWFIRSPLSHNILDGMMKALSCTASLSRVYTNHCLRATSIVHMKKNGFEDRKICAVTGHKNIASLSSYDVMSRDEAGALADAIDLKPASASCSSSPHSQSTVSRACEPAESAPASASSSGFTLYAAGASFSNVTFNVMPRLSLNRKRRREQKAALALAHAKIPKKE